MVRIFMTYQPFNFFVIPGLISFAIGILIGLQPIFYLTMGKGHIQSLILAAVLLSLGGFLVITGLLADLISIIQNYWRKSIGNYKKY